MLSIKSAKFEYQFRSHIRDIENGRRSSLCSELIEEAKNTDRGASSLGLFPGGTDPLALLTVQNHIDSLFDALMEKSEKGKEMRIEFNEEADHEKQLFLLGMTFLKSCNLRSFDEAFVRAYIDSGLDVNFRPSKGNGNTAIHILAAQNDIEAVNWLIECERCTYLLFNHKFLLPHEMASPYAEVNDMCERLWDLELTQARNEGFETLEDYFCSPAGPWTLLSKTAKEEREKYGLPVPKPLRDM